MTAKAIKGADSLTKWALPQAPDRHSLNHSDRHVALLSKQEDFETIMLASMGLTAKAITKRSGYSVGQVYYRLRKAGVKITDYRNGTSVFAQLVMEQVGRKAAQKLTQNVRALISV